MKFLLIPLSLVLLLTGCATTVVSVDRAVEEIAWNTIDMIPEGVKPVIAVYNLRDMTSNGEVNKLLVARLTTQLANAAREEERDIIIVSRQVFNEVFQEHAFILSDLSEEKQQLEIGKLLGADLILTGDLTRTEGDLFNVNTQLVDIESGKVIGGDTFEFWINMPDGESHSP